MTNSKVPNTDTIDIEEHANTGMKVPKGRTYRIRIDRDKYTVDVECMTGKELLALANKLPTEKYQINQKTKGGEVKKVGNEEITCFTEPGVERYMTLKLDPMEG